MNRHITLAIALAGCATTAFGYNYAAQTGALSYTVFNLSPNSCTFTPYGGGANSSAISGNPGASYGWNGGSGEDGFFQTDGFAGSAGSPESLVANNYIFFNSADPVTSPSPSLSSVGSGTSASTVEYSSQMSPGHNAPAIADSWTVVCGSGGTMVMANMASASNLFISGNGANYPYNSSLKGSWFNYELNPPSAGGTANSSNPVGAGFVATTMNLNSSSGTSIDTSTNPNTLSNTAVQTGGLWMGLNNPNTNNYAVNSLNLAMYPVNLAAYVTNNAGDNTYQYATPLYGGHFTLAVGDPFIISSYAAKTLWYMVANNGIALQNNTLGSTGMTDLIGSLTTDNTTAAVFLGSSTSNSYLQWLLGTNAAGSSTPLGSPGLASNVINTLNTAASTPITKESIWGPVVSSMVQVATDTAIVSIALLAGPEASVGTVAAVTAATGAATAADGALMPSATSAINADFTTTVSQPAPTSQTAPPVVNDTYSAGNLLGMLLVNSFVQADINNALNLNNNSTMALWSNYYFNTDTTSPCIVSGSTPPAASMNVTNNLMSGTCGGNANLPPNTGYPAQAYTNVLSTYPSSVNSQQLSIWDAILTGADITTNASNYLVVDNPTIAAFAPPTQVVNSTGATNNLTSVNPSFNNSSGLLTVSSYTTPVSAGTTPSTLAPNINVVTGNPPPTGWAYSTSFYSYSYSKGVLTLINYSGGVTGDYYAYSYDFSNGNQTLDMSTCAPNSTATLTLNAPPGAQNASGASGTLSCTLAIPVVGTVGSYPAAASTPTVNVVTPQGTLLAAITVASSQITYPASPSTSSTISVAGYTATTNNVPNTITFLNGTQTLDTTSCPSNTAVQLTVYPSSISSGLGFLSCQSTPSNPILAYSACTSDPNATGGVIVALTGAPSTTTGTGATFALACACIPPYLGGPTVISSATSATTPNPAGTTSTGPSFLLTGATGSATGIMVGATSVNPANTCN